MIRIEDLGEPIQLLLKDMQAKGKVDMDLLEFIRVKDVAKVFEAQSLGKESDEIWNDLQTQLRKRKEAKEDPHGAQRSAAEEERKAQEEADKQALEEANRRLQDAERRAKEEAATRALEEENRRIQDSERRAKEEADRRALEEAHRRVQEAERKAKEEADRRAHVEEQRRLQEEAAQQVEANRKAEEERKWEELRLKHEEEKVQWELEMQRREEEKRKWDDEEQRRRQELRLKMEEEELARKEDLYKWEADMQKRKAEEEERWQKETAEREQLLQRWQEEERKRAEVEQERQMVQERRRAEEEEEWRRREEEARRKREAESRQDEQEREAARRQREAEEQEWERKMAQRKAEEDAEIRKRQGALKERQRLLEEEDRKLLEDPTVHWLYFGPGAVWKQFPADIQQTLEYALMESETQCAVQLNGMQWTVFLEKMYASDSQGQHMPVKRIYGDEPTVDSEPTLRTGSLVVWSSLNPQSRKWERFPLLVSRVLELKYQTGAPSCEVLILGKLQYSIVFADMKQVDSKRGHFRHVQRSRRNPSWECFNPAAVAWEPVAKNVATQLEYCFATGEQSATIVTRDANGQERVTDVELRDMRQRVGAQSLGLRRQLQDDGAEDVVQATGSASAQANAAHAQSAVTPPATPPRTPPRRPSPAHVGPAEHHAAPAARRTASQPKSSIFLEVYQEHPEEVERVMSAKIRPKFEVALNQGATLVGREAAEGGDGLVVVGPGMSRRHCTVEVSPTNQILLTDAGSTVGCFVYYPRPCEYRKLHAQQQYEIPAGTFMRWGHTLVRLCEIF